MAQSTDISPVILKQLSDNYNITVTPKRKDEAKTRSSRPSNLCKLTVRDVYKALLRTDEDFGFNFRSGKSYKDEDNKRVTDRVVNAVIASEGGMDKCLWSLREIEGACKTYFISLRDAERRKEKGKDKEHAVNSRRLSRRRERAARLKKTIRGVKEEALHGISRDKLLKVMEPEYLSSEESDLDEDGKFVCFKVRRLRWQRDTFRELKDHLEDVHRDQLTPQHQGQLKKREVMERFSSRGAPEDCPKFVRRK